MTSIWDGIQGQDTAVRTLDRALRTNHLAHAYLFEGQSGVGKQKTALALATALVCPNGGHTKSAAGSCEACRRVFSGSHPDVRVYGPREEGNRNLPIEFVREEILPFARFAPFEASSAVVIFPEADISFPIHHCEAANALLKAIEEPKAGVVFVFLSERPDRLLTTIRSRCQAVRFRALSASVLTQILQDAKVEPAKQDLAIALANGSADRALHFSEGNLLSELASLARIEGEVVRHSGVGPILEFCEDIARREGELHTVLDTLAVVYRDIAVVGSGSPDESLMFHSLADKIRQRARTLSVHDASSRALALQQVKENIERNANVEIALNGLFFGFAPSSRS